MSEIDVLNLRAKQILNENDKGGYTIPTDGLYPFQWNCGACHVRLHCLHANLVFL